MEVTTEMVQAAIVKAIQRELFKKHVDIETYVRDWHTVELMLKAAIEKSEEDR